MRIKKIIKDIINSILPIYIRFYPSYYWLAIWSAPTTPATIIDYWKALRITIRKDPYHSKLLWVIKKGIEDSKLFLLTGCYSATINDKCEIENANNQLMNIKMNYHDYEN